MSTVPSDVRLAAMERAVLQLAATGAVTDELAAHLSMSPDAVRQHLAAAMDRLGVRSKLEAVVVALRLGLIELAVD